MRTISCFLALVVVGCGGATETAPEYPPNPDNGGNAEVTSAPPSTAQEVEAPPPPPAPVQVVAGENSAIEGPTPTLRATSPRNGARIARGPVMVNATLANWSLAPDPGNHVHVIVDNEPYIAIRDLSRPFDLVALVHDNLGHDLAEGSHLVRMFPSRPTHESVKDARAFVAFTFVYGHPTEGFAFDARQPLLTYSRPKGCNVVGSRVLLDFYLTNVAALAADGFRVQYTVDSGLSGDITSWAPHYIENLPAGEHTIRLQLLGANGQPVAGPYNDTSRTITVAETCPDPHAAAPATPAAAAPATPENAAGHTAH